MLNLQQGHNELESVRDTVSQSLFLLMKQLLESIDLLMESGDVVCCDIEL